ncbi:MAG: hypothetical protein D6784_02245 [Chloroflexi bacterium]|nr:MAG: hypothetical protein D6784_02245 [Chloroflexota bacterium]
MSRSRKQAGRIVLNHSTHLPGLLPLLARLAEEPGIKTITPGRIAPVKGRPTPLRVRVTTPIIGGYKLQARAQGSVQEVFVVTDMAADDLQTLLNRLLAR